MHKENLDTKKLEASFSESLIIEIDKTIESLSFDAYFSNLNAYANRTSKPCEHFKGTLFAPNICMLDYILKNINEFKNLTFLDYGSGLGIFSAFLNQIKIKCINFDNGTQLTGHNSSEAFFEKYKQNKPTSDPQKVIEKKPKVLTTSGCWITEESLFDNYEYLMIDPKARKKCSSYGNCNFNPHIENNYTKITSYLEDQLDIFRLTTTLKG